MQAGSAGAALVQKCPVNFKLASANKGFEGAHVFKGKDGGRYLLGLCEGGCAAALRMAQRPCVLRQSELRTNASGSRDAADGWCRLPLLHGSGVTHAALPHCCCCRQLLQHYCITTSCTAQVLRMLHCRTAAAAAAGNFCSSGEKGRRPGNGRLVVTKFNGKAAGTGCAWDYVKTLNIPSDAYFEDYSDIAVSGNQVRPPAAGSCTAQWTA